MQITLKSMRYFLAVVKNGSISSAAEQLHIAASAVSSAVDQIEAHFQMKLMTRHRSKGIQLTSAGRALTRKFEALMDNYDALIVEGAEMRQALTGQLKIGYYAPVAPAFIPQIAMPLLTQNPKLRLDLEECDNDRAQLGLLDGSYDVILFVAEVVRPTIEYDVLCEVPAYCLVSEGHALAGQKSISLSDLSYEPMIALNRPVASAYYQQLFESTGAKPNTVAVANSTEMVRSLVGAGLGCAILNMRPAIDISYAGNGVRAIPLSGDLSALTFAIGYTKTNPRLVVRSFVEAFHAYFNSEQGAKHIVF
jgi:DNA-binding transcriptional LysR family regulator